ncbi:MAG: hypothetical protein U0S48_16440 [Solirubrobacteraceae bacterium]
MAWGIEKVPADVLPLETLQAEFDRLGDERAARPSSSASTMPMPGAPSRPARRRPSRRLGVKTGTVCQILEQVMYAGGRPVQWGKAYLLPKHYRLHVRRRVTLVPPVVRRPG